MEEFKINQLLDKDNFEDGIIGIRDRLIIMMFYSMGIRLSELINMESSNIDLKTKTIKVVGKRNKERIIPISTELSDVIRCYEAEKEKTGYIRSIYFPPIRARNYMKSLSIGL